MKRPRNASNAAGNRNVAASHRRTGLRFRIVPSKICAIYPSVNGSAGREMAVGEVSGVTRRSLGLPPSRQGNAKAGQFGSASDAVADGEQGQRDSAIRITGILHREGSGH